MAKSERSQGAMAQFFDAWSHDYEDRFAGGRLRRHLIDRRMEPIVSRVGPDDVFVEVGCGTGASMSEVPCVTYGFDMAPSMAEQAHQRGQRVLVASGTHIPLKDNTADIVATQLVLHHVNFYLGYSGVVKILQEMVRITKPGGSIAILEANPWNAYWYFFMWRHGEDNARLIRPGKLLRSIRQACGANPHISYLGFLPEVTPAWAVGAGLRIEKILETLPTKHVAGNYAIVCNVKS